MSELVEFLLARIAEDEQDVRRASDFGDLEPKWYPARVLAECEAKRRIIELHIYTTTRMWAPFGTPDRGADGCVRVEFCDTCEPTDRDGDIMPDAESWPCETLRLLALPYADHPGYQAVWRPADTPG